MCKVWPGLRCTDHPHQKIVKYSTNIHKKYDQVSNVDSLMLEIAKGLPQETEPASDAAWVSLSTQRQKLLNDISAIDKKREDEIANYATTKGGQEELAKVAADDTEPIMTRMEAATEQTAGETRRQEQKELGKILNNPDLEDEAKILYATKELKASNESIKKLSDRIDVVKNNLAYLQNKIEVAKEAGDKEEVKALGIKKAAYMTELSLLEKQLNQKKIKREELKKWIARFYDKNVNRIFNLNEKLIRSIFRIPWS